MKIYKKKVIKIISSTSLLSCVSIYWYIKNVSIIEMNYIFPFHVIAFILWFDMNYGFKRDNEEVKDIIKVLIVKNDNKNRIKRFILLLIFNFLIFLFTYFPLIFFFMTYDIDNMIEDFNINPELFFVRIWCLLLSVSFIYFCIVRNIIDILKNNFNNKLQL